ncbi:glycosyltransferase family 2 protein [Levilactobacillus fujinensis]|uniref:Glycosyltransferase family 2 protein n=1 Tax=Levilactobacillus fujinensis TaxID=2486024 RepID=A0ABW1TGP2_9LACO|nr:glycosyltransferase family 2 protein [Levilactobacillus fujinensis]
MKSIENVAILMSTFNGADFIEQQIESICEQSYEGWTLYIRDDGSTDETLNIIRKFMKNDHRIVLYEEEKPVNLGPAESFMTMLSRIDANYYLFSDQDDFWLSDKVEKTLLVMKRLNQHEPNLVHTNLSLTDRELEVSAPSFSKTAFDDVQSILLANDITGCTVMINRKLRDLVKYQISIPCMHDMWLGLIAAQFGNVDYIKASTMLYRQHGNNVVGSTTNKMAKIKGFNSISEKNRLMTTVLTARELLKKYGNYFSIEERKTLITLSQLGKVSLFKSLWRIKKNRIYKHSFLATTSFILKIMLNYSSLKSSI